METLTLDATRMDSIVDAVHGGLDVLDSRVHREDHAHQDHHEHAGDH
jgi:hypothetical protein